MTRTPADRPDPAAELLRVLDIMARLRDPEHGCPWDRAQSFETIAPYTVEESYEVADAIERGALEELPQELGDLLFQVVFHAQMAREQGLFDFAAVARALADKLTRRHPHVFGGAEAADAEAVRQSWERLKAEEREAGKHGAGTLAGIARNLPALVRAEKLQRRAARVGFDWPSAEGVLDKLREEVGELQAEMGEHPDASRLRAELGDVLFACVNLARHLGVDAERALREANARFERRFGHIEQRLGERGLSPQSAGLETLERLWQEAKEKETPRPGDDPPGRGS